MDVEPIKDRQPFALTLAAFLDLTPFFIDGVDFIFTSPSTFETFGLCDPCVV